METVTLQQRLSSRKLFVIILKEKSESITIYLKSPSYIHELVLPTSRSYRIRQCDKIPLFNFKYNLFRKSFSISSKIK